MNIIELDSRATSKTVEALVNRLDTVQEGGFFEDIPGLEHD